MKTLTEHIICELRSSKEKAEDNGEKFFIDLNAGDYIYHYDGCLDFDTDEMVWSYSKHLIKDCHWSGDSFLTGLEMQNMGNRSPRRNVYSRTAGNKVMPEVFEKDRMFGLHYLASVGEIWSTKSDIDIKELEKLSNKAEKL